MPRPANERLWPCMWYNTMAAELWSSTAGAEDQVVHIKVFNFGPATCGTSFVGSVPTLGWGALAHSLPGVTSGRQGPVLSSVTGAGQQGGALQTHTASLNLNPGLFL